MSKSNIFKSVFVSDTIALLERSLNTDQFIDLEKSKVELKDLSTNGEWISLKETICAFLNTDGGLVICGVREKSKKYSLTGFNRDNESNIIQLQTKDFKNDRTESINVSENIFFDYVKIDNKDVLIIVVYPLSDDLKYVSYNGKFFERKLTQDKEIPLSKLTQHTEYKNELVYAKEIDLIHNASISDLSIDKINYYVNLLNVEIRSETLKPSLIKAKPFLVNQHFLNNDRVSLLGMLVCGTDPFHFLSSKAEVNAYFDTSSDIGRDKKIFRSDIISLMEDSFRYIWGNIKINRTINEGGKSVPEYPEKLIRETINNALAHRDYSIDNFITVKVEPNKYIEISNPGSFKEKIKVVDTSTEREIRRLKPGIPESKNPKLASILKVFDKIESQGRGMASLVNEALSNAIDLPYYKINDGSITLFIPTGKLVDDSIETWLNGFEKYIENKIQSKITFEHKAVLAYFYKSELKNRNRDFTILLSEGNNHFDVINELKESKLLIEHPASTEITPVYVLDKTLIKTDFKNELLALIGKEFIDFDTPTKHLLNLIYIFSKYKDQPLKASQITPEVYRKLYGAQIVAKTYESLNRKVRSLVNSLNQKEILIKVDSQGYVLNFGYQKKNHLFS